MDCLLQGQHVGQEELVLIFWTEEAVLDKHQHDITDGCEIGLVDLEEARVEGGHDVVVEDLDITRLEHSHVLDELRQLSKVELPNIDCLIAEAFKRLMNEHFPVTLIFEELHHVYNNLGLDGLQILLQLLDRVELKLAQVKRAIILIIGQLLLEHAIDIANEPVTPVEIQDSHILLS